MKTNEIIAGLRKLCGQGTEYRRTVCRLAADLLEHQQKRIAELEAELQEAIAHLRIYAPCQACGHYDPENDVCTVSGTCLIDEKWEWYGGTNRTEGNA